MCARELHKLKNLNKQHYSVVSSSSKFDDLREIHDEYINLFPRKKTRKSQENNKLTNKLIDTNEQN